MPQAARAPSLDHLQTLYNRGRFLEAFRESAEYWTPATSLEDLSTDELILGSRLAVRLGGRRLSRYLLRAALKRDPSNPRVRYFTSHLTRRGWTLFDQLRALEREPDLGGDDTEARSSWFAYHAMIWAYHRDFRRAHDFIEHARALQIEEDWVFSCEADVLGYEGRWKEALVAAEKAWEINPGTPYGAQSIGASLLNLGRVNESSARLAAAAENCESFEVTQLAVWHLCAHAETLEGKDREQALERARCLGDKIPSRAPLGDREFRAMFARVMLDVACLNDDHAEMERWSAEAQSPFHAKLLESFRNNREGVRIRLPFRHGIQKHDACLPTSLASALVTVGVTIDPDAMAAELTFGGTAEWDAAEWLQNRGLEVRFFAATPEVAARLIKNGIAFTFTLDFDASAHAVAAVGLDERAGTLIVHDPQSFRATEYLLEVIGRDEAPLGPKAMAAVPSEKAALLDQLLPKADVEAMTARERYHRASRLQGPSAAAAVLQQLSAQHPDHPITRLLRALHALETGHSGEALAAFQQLLAEFPNSAFVRSLLLSSCRSVGNTALMRATLAAVVERGILPGIESQQKWIHPPAAYISEYADLLRLSAETRGEARSLLYSVIRTRSTCAEAWHNLGDLLWHEHDIDGAMLAFRIATCLATNNEHYAQAYCDALGKSGRQEEGLRWLEDRVQQYGRSVHGVAAWVTWISALEDLGRPEEALRVSQEARSQHRDAPELLAFVIPFLARMGQWDEAEALLGSLEQAGNSALFHQAAVDFWRMRGELDRAIQHGEAWIREAPLYMRARYQLAGVIAKRDGVAAAAERAATWVAERPGHDELDELHYRQIDATDAPRWRKYRPLLRRIKRNPEDAWAWRQLAFACIQQYEVVNESRRSRLEPRIREFIQQSDRTAPGNSGTLRLHAEWSQARREWKQAVEESLVAIDSDPENTYSYRHAWSSAARLDAEQRLQLWERMQPLLLSSHGYLTAARDVIMLVAQRFGVALAEEAVSKWREVRRDDPEIVEAAVDLLLQYGHGRSDAQRALEILKPAVERFPHHAALRFSLADAYRQCGRLQEAEDVFHEIVRRHPDNTAAQIQLAGVHERHGRMDQAISVLKTAAERDPHNSDVPDAQVQMLMRAGRFKDARSIISRTLQSLPESVHWRQRAIRLLINCGDHGAAVAAAREGIVVHPRGAYLWLLLAIALTELPRYAAQGEIEQCLRRSFELNPQLFETADRLTMLLAQQRRWSEAEDVMQRIEERLADPSPAQGRMAWIVREKGNKPESIERLTAVVQATPWYRWGWGLLMKWLTEDQAWNKARKLLATVPPELKTDTQFRQDRLVTLEKAGLPLTELDAEWNDLLRDFPEEIPLHLLRYDSLRDARRTSEAAAVLDGIRGLEPNNPYMLARYVEVLAREKKKSEAIDVLLRLFFAEVEESVWPAAHAWDAIRSARFDEAAYESARKRLLEGSRPTPQSFSLMAAYAVERGNTEKKTLQPRWRTWFPDRGARELLLLLKTVDSAGWAEGHYRADLIKQLSDVGYHRLAINYWKTHPKEVESDTYCWSQVGRALVSAHDYAAARRFMAGWRDRPGVAMWMVTNYVIALPPVGTAALCEVLASSQDALLRLPHDHCARYLVHRLADAAARLDDQGLFMETWNKYKSYFNEKLKQGEWFEPRRDYLRSELPLMAECLEQNRRRSFRWKVWGLKWKSPLINRQILPVGLKLRWSWIIWILWWLLVVVSGLFQSLQSRQ